MAAFASDLFTGTGPTAITSHSATLGGPWVRHSYATDVTAPNVTSNVLVKGDTGTNIIYYLTASPASADYIAQLDYTHNGGANEIAGPAVRMSTSASTAYFAILFQSAAEVRIYKVVAGTLTQVGSGVALWVSSGETYRIILEANGTTIRAKVQVQSNSLWLTSGGGFNASEQWAISTTDSAISSAGKAGFWLSQASGTNATIDNYSTDEASVGVAPDITTTSLPGGSIGTSYSQTLTATGSTPITWSVASGSLPAGLSLNTGTGAITGTPTTAGTSSFTIGATNGTSPDDTQALSIVISTGPATVAVTNSTIFFSPFNWYSDGGGSMAANNVKGSSTYALSNNPGAYLKFKITLATTGDVILNFDNANLSTVSAGDFPQVAVFKDQGAPTVTQLSGTSTQALTIGSSLAAGTYSFVVLFKAAGLTTSDRWTTPRLSVKVTGLTVPSDATMVAPTLRTDRAMIFGDSITEGVHALGTTLAPADQDAGYTWAHMLAAALDAEVGIVGFGGQGWADMGVGNVPVFSTAYDDYYSGASRLVTGAFSPVPDWVMVAHGENDTTGGSLSTTIGTVLADIRTAAGTIAPIYVVVPFTGKIRSDIGAATLPSRTRIIDAQLSGGDGSHLVYYPGYQTPLHPSILGSAYIAPRLQKLIERGGTKAAQTATVTLVNTSGTAQASLTSLKWAWYDQVTPNLHMYPADQGEIETTDGSGVLTISVMTTLASGATGWLVVTNSDGSAATNHKAFAGPVVLS